MTAGNHERGTVTAEFAIGLPAVVLTVLLALGAILGGVNQVRCVEAARVATRVAALGASPQDITAAAHEVLGPAAGVTVTYTPGPGPGALDGGGAGSATWVHVRVDRPIATALGGLFRATATLTGPVEPGLP